MTALLPMLFLLAAPQEPDLRLAVVVGSNAASGGRSALRYAQADAQAMAEVLIENGRFARDDVWVLLEEGPEAVRKALAAARARAQGHAALLLFYFSGHADSEALYPGGEALRLGELKRELEDGSFALKLGIIDSCRGGTWTQAKGLVAGQVFEPPPSLLTEGTALVASSSGQEDAHEADALQGSFFTHHLVAGLRGAADVSGDGQVSLQEAFAYANRLTIRDTAAHARVAQHPSFELRLRGRNDVLLTSLGGDSTVLALTQQTGPLEIVQLSTGLVMVEAPAGERVIRVVLPPGPYLVRQVSRAGVSSREVQVVAGQTTTVAEGSLTLEGHTPWSSKGFGRAEELTATTSAQGSFMSSLRVGFDLNASGAAATVSVPTVSYALTDRLQLFAPGVAYRVGERGGHEALFSVGAWDSSLRLGGGVSPLVRTTVGAAVDGRSWFGRSSSLLYGLSWGGRGEWGPGVTHTFADWALTARLGYSHTVGDRLTLNLGLTARETLLVSGHLADLRAGEGQTTLALGGIGLGLRSLPMVQVHVTPELSVDLDPRLELNLAKPEAAFSFGLGVTQLLPK